MQDVNITIITGLSGSGKSCALDAFEDSGYYCVDNLPVALLPKFLEMPVQTSSVLTGLAFVMDLRESDFVAKSREIFTDLKEKGYNIEILFLEADEDVLIRRYSQTRRHHPLAGDRGLVRGIREEKKQLHPLRQASDRIIDTSKTTVHDLKALVLTLVQQTATRRAMRITILSFGFKYGIPHDADIIMDVRFLPNPYFVETLKNLDGRTKSVNNYVLNNETASLFLEKFLALIDFLVPLYENEPKAYLTIAIGCTGGFHRSVAVAQKVFEHVAGRHPSVAITHRDVKNT
ncbi:MAG: RNase adapter RapZ [Thermodesulfobacteriota bacterium]|nr:RNase adapter RapZ [Thermodesulfobacteriota bacterium]